VVFGIKRPLLFSATGAARCSSPWGWLNSMGVSSVFKKINSLKNSILCFFVKKIFLQNLKMWRKMGECGNYLYICGGELQACIPHTAFVRLTNSRNSF
jgi:hypothetical protein